MAAPRVWGLVPAAGRGERFGADQPKQYLELLGHSLLEHSVNALLAHPRVEGVTVALAVGDERFAGLRFTHPGQVDSTLGGATRATSVLRGLEHIAARHGADWALVHDAARPCLSPGRLDALLEQGLRHPDGALLALPAPDTLKEAGDEARVARTVDRSKLWLAQTPQLFPVHELLGALRKALEDGYAPTDEAEAMERAGRRPLLVRGDSTNLKVTWPADLALAEAVLAKRHVAE